MKKNVLIYLHGENATGSDYANFKFANFDMICPTAPLRDGINSWIDYDDNNPTNKSINNISKQLLGIIKKQVKIKKKSCRVFIGGSSQGAALAMHIYALYCSQYKELGGFMGCRSDRLYHNTNVEKLKNYTSPINFYCGGKDIWDKGDDKNITVKKCINNYKQFLEKQNPKLDVRIILIGNANHKQMGELEYNCIKNFLKI